MGFADYLTEVPNVPPSLREPLTVIQEEAERASNIVKNLLSFARKQEHQRRPTALKPLLDATFLLLRNNLMAHRVEATLEVEPDLPMPDIDPNQIQQVFVNLINNAAQAIASTGRPGRVVVRARRWLDGVAMDVADDGPGMSEALAAQVFEPFFTTKPEGEGTGLGLSISQGIVREHGGRIMLTTRGGAGVDLHGAAAARDPAAGAHARLGAAGADPTPPRAGGGRRAAHPALHAGDAGGMGPHPGGGERRRGSAGRRGGRQFRPGDLRPPDAAARAAASSTRSWPGADPSSPRASSSAPATP